MTQGCFDWVNEGWELKKKLYFYPSFPFNRIMYLLVDGCTFDRCIRKYEFVTPEMWNCCYAIYFDAVFYLIIAIYLQEVVP
jgi:hypothetical protein